MEEQQLSTPFISYVVLEKPMDAWSLTFSGCRYGEDERTNQ